MRMYRVKLRRDIRNTKTTYINAYIEIFVWNNLDRDKRYKCHSFHGQYV